MDRFRSLPISSGAVVLGRCLADMLSSAIGLLILIAAGRLLGWQWQRGPLAAAGAIGLLLLLRFALLWIGMFIGLSQKTLEASPAQLLTWPVGFLSNVFVDPATMPAWLGALAAWNPLSATAAAARQLFGNPTFSSTSGAWAAQHALTLATLWPLLIIAAFAPLSARTFRTLGE
jgi:ABC-2 type transport system permease protein